VGNVGKFVKLIHIIHASFVTEKVNTYNPHSPWQKGAVENLNGRIRALLPKNSSVRGVSTSHIDWIENIINNTPLKVLGYLTPLEALYKNTALR